MIMVKKIIFLLFLLPTLSFATSLNSDYMFGLRSKNFKVYKANAILKSLNKLNIVSCPSAKDYNEFVDCLSEVYQFDCSNYNKDSKFSVDSVKLQCNLYSLLLKIMYASVTEEILLNNPDSPAIYFPKNNPDKILDWAIGVSFILDLSATVRITDHALRKF